MRDVNSVTLLGRLGQDPKQIQTKTGKTMVVFSFATGRRGSKSDATAAPQDDTTWHRICTFGHDAEYALRYLKKGHPAMLMGSIQTRVYKSKEDDSNRFITQINVNQLIGLGAPARASQKETINQALASVTEPEATVEVM